MTTHLAVLAACFLLCARAFAAPAEQPNIVFVLFDDMGCGQPKCYREGTEFKTPNLDRLEAEGMRFTDSTTCKPT